MANAMPPPLQQAHTTSQLGEHIEQPEQNKPRLAPMTIPLPIPIPAGRNGQISLDVFSPINQNGSFEFDRVLKSGHVYKRSRKTKQWKKFFLVLRSNLLSMYKNESEVKLLKQVNLLELTAVNILKDPKGRREHMFGLFTSSHNYHFQAGSAVEAQSWVDILRKEAKIDEEEESIAYGSPPTANATTSNLGKRIDTNIESGRIFDRLASSSPEPADPRPQVASPTNLIASPHSLNSKTHLPQPRQQSLNEFDYSGQEQASYSDFSDTAPQSFPRSSYNTQRVIPVRPATKRTGSYASAQTTAIAASQPQQGSTYAENARYATQAASRTDLASSSNNDSQRVLWQGYLLVLKSKGGVRAWKRLWAVLRPAHLAFYKNAEEYSIQLLLTLPTILSAIEIDPLSRSKAYCMQIISEDKNYRFCAEDEESLLRCLGALKSLLARRKGANATAGQGGGNVGLGTGTVPAPASITSTTNGVAGPVPGVGTLNTALEGADGSTINGSGIASVSTTTAAA